MSENIKVAILGSAESTAPIADALKAAALDVTTLTPLKLGAAPTDEFTAAVTGADLVFCLLMPNIALKTATDLGPQLKPGALYADFSATAPALKRQLAELFTEENFIDAMFISDSENTKSSLVLAGGGAAKLTELLEATELEIENISEIPGKVAARRVLRSVLDKSLAASLIDFLWMAESVGEKDWAYAEIMQEFETSSAQTAQNYLSDTAKNFKRLQMELMDALEAMREFGHESTMAAPIDYTYGSMMHGRKIPFSNGK